MQQNHYDYSKVVTRDIYMGSGITGLESGIVALPQDQGSKFRKSCDQGSKFWPKIQDQGYHNMPRYDPAIAKDMGITAEPVR